MMNDVTMSDVTMRDVDDDMDDMNDGGMLE
jgi:hypothetical protein